MGQGSEREGTLRKKHSAREDMKGAVLLKGKSLSGGHLEKGILRPDP